MKVGFETVASYLPEEVINIKSHYAYLNPAFAKLPGPEQKKLESAVPDEVRRFKGTDAMETMAVKAARAALDSSGLKPADINCILATKIGGKQLMPEVGAYVQHNVGFDLSTDVRNVANDSASFLNACHIAWNLVRSGEYKRVLIVASSSLISGESGFEVDLTDPYAKNFGDGAAAAIVSSQNLKCEFLSYYSEFYGQGCQSARMKPVSPLANPDLADKAGIKVKVGQFIATVDPSVVQIAGRKNILPDNLVKALKKASLRLADLDLVIAHHLGDLETGWKDDLVRAGLSAEKFKNLRKKYGNMAAADLPIDLAEFWKERLLKKNSLIALWAPASGVQLATLVIRWLV